MKNLKIQNCEDLEKIKIGACIQLDLCFDFFNYALNEYKKVLKENSFLFDNLSFRRIFKKCRRF